MHVSPDRTAKEVSAFWVSALATETLENWITAENLQNIVKDLHDIQKPSLVPRLLPIAWERG